MSASISTSSASPLLPSSLHQAEDLRGLKTTFLEYVAGYSMHLPASRRRKRVFGFGVFQRADAEAFLAAVLDEFLVLVVRRQFAP